MTDLLRVIFTGGGTGGHLNPGIAVADEIRARFPACDIMFVGSERSLERRIIREAGYDHFSTPIMSSTDLKRSPLRFAINYWKSRRLAKKTLLEVAPQIVIGLGGFASLPIVRSAQSAGIPTLLLEQNIVPGRATRWLMKRTERVCHSFEAAARLCSPPEKQFVTGNPVRREIATLLATELRVKKTPNPTILILGGSQGSVSVNRIWFSALKQLSRELSSCRVFHQTGEADCRLARQTYNDFGISAISEPYFEILPTIYQQSDFVISRAGATTLAELACAGLPAILIPFPNSIGDHQVKNALHFAEQGAAVMIEQTGKPSDDSDSLCEAIRAFLTDDSKHSQQAMRELAHPDAATNVLDQILRLIK